MELKNIIKQNKIIRVYKRPYIVFGIMFGSSQLLVFIIGIARGDFPLLSLEALKSSFIPFGVVILLCYTAFWLGKIEYNDEEVIYRGILGVRRVKIKDIKSCKLMHKDHRNPLKPIFGIFIDTKDKKDAIVIPPMLYDSDELNEFMDFIKSKNPKIKGKNRAGKSIFEY